MPCEPTPGGFMCSRGGRAPKCSVTGCNARATKQCDYSLRGTRTGQTCSKYLCDAHAVVQGEVTRLDAHAVAQGSHLIARASKDAWGAAHYEDSVDFCPAHAELAKRSTP